MIILGIDPGQNTGIAVFEDGALKSLETITPQQMDRYIRECMPARVVFEDSRLQSHTWSQAPSRAAAA